MIEQDALTQLVLEHKAIPAKFFGQHFLLDAKGALYWPKQDMLVFSDLHFEKGSFLTQFAHPVPRFDTRETLERMRMLISQYSPRRVICLGDSFHDGNAFLRMDTALIDLLNSMITQTENWTWILGNHDPQISPVIGGKREHELTIEGICFAHEPSDDVISSGKAMLFGHFHPKASAVIVRHKIVGSCFVCSEKVFIMPAFGKYTGGLSIKDEAIRSLFNGASAKVYLTYGNRVYLV